MDSSWPEMLDRPETLDRREMPDNAFDLPETPDPLAPLDAMNHIPPVNYATIQVRILETSPKPMFLMTDNIHQAQTMDDILHPVVQLLKSRPSQLMPIFTSTLKLVCCYPNGIHWSWKMALCIKGSIIQMATLNSCRSSFRPSCADLTWNGCTLTSVISSVPKRAWWHLAVSIFPSAIHLPAFWFETVLFAMYTSGDTQP